MRTFATSTSNDLVIGSDGSLYIVSEVAAVGECCKGVMQSRLNEMVFQYDEGIPFDHTVWSGIPNLQQFEAVSRARLAQVPNVRQIVSFTANMDMDVLRYTADIVTSFGRITING